MKEVITKSEKEEILKCGECRWYRVEYGECFFGGGWHHYPEPDDECARGFVKGHWFNT